MDIILLTDYEGLGRAGDKVTVKPGFARNKLIPQGVALRASMQNMSIIKEKKKNIEKLKKKESDKYDVLLKKLSKAELSIKAQVGDEDKMFGSITTNDISKALEDIDINIDRSSILLDTPIKSLGLYHIDIRLTKDHEIKLKLYVIKS